MDDDDLDYPATAMATALAALGAPCAHDTDRIDRIALIERSKASLAAVQRQIMVEFETSQLAEQERLGVPGRRRGRGIADQIALATKNSPATASHVLADARALAVEMPQLRDALAAGRVSALGAEVALRETRCLTRADRGVVDAELAPVVEAMSIRQIERAVRCRVIELDPDAAVRRAARARVDRCVSIRPLPDTMAKLTAILPVEQAVACYASLRAAAETAKAAGEERTKSQVQADTFVERITGQRNAAAIPTEIHLVMIIDALLGRSEKPAQLPAYGPLPAILARHIATSGVDADAEKARAWIRRLYTDPIDGTVTDIDHRRRRFPAALAAFIKARDQVRRDPYCDAPIRDLDHLHDYADGGETSAENGVGLCQRGNLVDQIPGWRTTGTARHRIVITPTGHHYDSRPPPALGRIVARRDWPR